MHHALVVNVVERQRQVQKRWEHLVERVTSQAGDRAALEQFHGEKRAAWHLAKFEDAQAMRMVQGGERAELALESASGRTGERRFHQLERDLAALAHVVRTVDDAHSSLAELVYDLKSFVP